MVDAFDSTNQGVDRQRSDDSAVVKLALRLTGRRSDVVVCDMVR